MAVKVIKADGKALRIFRFPPLCATPLAGDAELHYADQATLQRAVSDGYREGAERGYQEGLEQGLEAGRRQGFEEGCEQGRQRGLEQGRYQGLQRYEQATVPFEQMRTELRDYLAAQDRKTREDLLELVRKVARQVIRCELTINPTQLLALAEEALASMPGDPGEVQILLNPEEYARIKDIDAERAETWRLMPDDRLGLGECRVVTEKAEADIGCQQRLDSCMDTLAQHIKVSEA
ncbi:flagellar assembly protein FliH [Pseudomonas profundi]|uniref:flagellar assembly protein FliH n=1 Tax=Pseudomonas profundi TaxID=1981513 RepID=UPI00123A8F54|nr:flagellar assembly protein FliH [Pseudomonas profundi]